MPTIVMVVMFVLSSLAATMLCEAMQRIPGNHNFGHRYEFATVVLHYYGRRAYLLFQIFYNISLQALNIASMIISAQVLDKFLNHVGHSYALNYSGDGHWWQKTTGYDSTLWCSGDMVNGECHGTELTYIISLGFVICMVICIPFGYLNLDDNMWFQWFSLVGLLIFTIEFYVQFIMNFGKEDRYCVDEALYPGAYGNETCDYSRHMTVYNTSGTTGFDRTPLFVASIDGQAQVVGIAVFAYAYVVTIPSWVNEKKPSVNVNKAVWVPAVLGLFLKLLAGLLGAWAFDLVLNNGDVRDNASDILQILMLKNQPTVGPVFFFLF